MASVRLEAKAVLWAVKHFHYYIDGRKTVVYTDCAPIVEMFKNPKASHVIYKEAVLTQQYDLEVKYKPGRQNGG